MRDEMCDRCRRWTPQCVPWGHKELCFDPKDLTFAERLRKEAKLLLGVTIRWPEGVVEHTQHVKGRGTPLTQYWRRVETISSANKRSKDRREET